jgi:hypothetical protein
MLSIGGSFAEEDGGPTLPAVGCEVPALPNVAMPECTPPAGGCQTAADCPAGSVCLRLATGSRCTARCADDGGCEIGLTCTTALTGVGDEGYCAPIARAP